MTKDKWISARVVQEDYDYLLTLGSVSTAIRQCIRIHKQYNVIESPTALYEKQHKESDNGTR